MLAKPASESPLVDTLLLNQRDEPHGIAHVERMTKLKIDLPYQTKVSFGSISELATCDVVAFCYDRLMGGSRADFKGKLPPDFRRRLFNANIEDIIKDGREFGELHSKTLRMVLTNPPDQLAYYQDIAFKDALGELAYLPEYLNLTAGLNELDRQRVQAKIHEILIKSGIVPDHINPEKYLHTETFGKHDSTFTAFLSRQSVTIDGKTSPLMDQKGFNDAVFERLLREARTDPRRSLESFGTTSTETVNAFMRFLEAYATGEGLCALSLPVTDSPATGEIFPFLGQTVGIADRELITVCGRDLLEEEDQRLYDDLAGSAAQEIMQIDRKTAGVRRFIETNGGKASSLGRCPKYFRELAVPVNHDGYSELLFLNMTENFDSFEEIRKRVELKGNVIYTRKVLLEGKSKLALLMSEIDRSRGCGTKLSKVAIIDPAEPERIREMYLEGTTKHPNSLIIHNKQMYATARGEGIFKEQDGRFLRTAKNADGSFVGCAEPFGDGIVYAKKTQIAALDPPTLEEKVIFEIPTEKIGYLAVIRRAEDQKDLLLASTQESVYIIDPQTGKSQKAFSTGPAASLRADDQKAMIGEIKMLSIAHIYGELHIILCTQRKISYAPLETLLAAKQKTEFKTVEFSGETEGQILSFAPYELGGFAVLRHAQGRNHLYWHHKDKKGTDCERDITPQQFRGERPGGEIAIYEEST